MFDRRNIIYSYDGSFDGLMSVIFLTFSNHEIPADILIGENVQQSLGAVYCRVETSAENSADMQKAVCEKSSADAARKIYLCYLSNAEFKEMKILTYIHRCFKYGRGVNSHLNDKYVAAVLDAALSVSNEAHNLKGFVRFSELENNVMYAEISPVNRVLPCLIYHFTRRFPGLAFMIHDLTHRECLVYDRRECVIRDTSDLTPGLDYSENELVHRGLWKEFYNTVEIKERHNEKCRMTHMPKRYWAHLTEMN